jgi:aromatic ring-cleaving dioxygenase
VHTQLNQLPNDFHAHVYFNDDRQRSIAYELRGALVEKTGVEPDLVREKAGGPHPSPMVQFNFDRSKLGDVAAWLAMNRKGLSILIHPENGDPINDHGAHSMWMGQRLQIAYEAL